MQNLEDIREKVFFETKTILETLVTINSVDELLAKHDLLIEATSRLGFLRILERNEDLLNSPQSPSFSTFAEAEKDDFETEEEVIFTNELNDIDSDQLEDAEIAQQINSPEDYAYSSATTPVETALPITDSSPENENLQENQHDNSVEDQIESEVIFSEETDEKKSAAQPEMSIAENETLEQAERKFKLASIKALKTVKNSELEQKTEEVSSTDSPSGSLLKSNVATDFMEAERRKPEFRLDLNDRVAFTKSLFGGNVEELTATITKLNSFTNLEDAKQHLSDIYHQRNWKHADEYAQRLWSLVENKFM